MASGQAMRKTIVRPKSALTTDFVSGVASPYSDTGTTEDTNQDFTTSDGTADRLWMARKFTAPASGKVGDVQLVLGRTGTPAGTCAAYIYSDDGGSPSKPASVIGDASDSVTNADLSADAAGALQTFTFSGTNRPELVANTANWVVV